MHQWPDRRILDLLQIEIPILQAPMAGSDTALLAAEVSEAGGLGAVACTTKSGDEIRAAVSEIRKRTAKPFNLNFFCHESPPPEAGREERWRERLAPFYRELGIGPGDAKAGPVRAPFDEKACLLLEELRPAVASFHFGLPAASLVERIKRAGIRILSSATSVEEAVWLEERGCDAVIAQGLEAGGHRAMFLRKDPESQVGTLALVPQIADAVKVPVIAAGGIGDGRGIAAAFVLGASAAQLGTAYLFCPEAVVSPLARERLRSVSETETLLTNVFSGRLARGIRNRFILEAGPVSDLAPSFPLAAAAVAPLRAKSEALGKTDFMQIWCGQAARLARENGAREMTLRLAREARARLSNLLLRP